MCEWFDGGRLRGVWCARRSPQAGLSALRFTRASTKDHVLITPDRLRFGGRACHDESMRDDIRERVTYLAEAIGRSARNLRCLHPTGTIP